MKNKERQSNFELMRIVSMLFIVIWHVIVHGKVFENISEPASFISTILLGFLVVHVNSLVFITGYFGTNNNKINNQKVGKLIGITWFYKAVIVLIVILFNIATLSKITIMEELLPLDLNNYWFINCYLIVYILSPYLNKVTEKMEEHEFAKFLLLLLVTISIIPIISSGRIINNNGSNIINFIFMYYLGSYFKKYPIDQNYHLKYTSRKKKIIILSILFFIMGVFNISLYYLGEKMCNINSGLFEYLGSILIRSFTLYSNPLVIIQSCVYCLLFESINIKSKTINFIAKSTFGIYLIHDNHLIRSFIYKYLIKPKPTTVTAGLYNLIKVSIIIFAVCFIIETIRRLITDLMRCLFYKSRSLFQKKYRSDIIKKEE